MEKLSMCRICVSDDMPLRSIVDTHLHEMYEVLTKMPFVTERNHPIVACDPCCASLEDCYELRRRCLSSEKRFTQLLTRNVVSKQQQDDLQILPDRHLTSEDVCQKIPIEYIDVEVKQEVVEEKQADSSTSPDLEDITATCNFIKVEIETDNEMPDDAAVEQDDAELHQLYAECDVTIVKEEPDDVDTGAPVCKESRLATQMNYEDTPANNLTRSDQTKDNIEEPKSETKRAVVDKPVKKNKIVETRDKLDIRLRYNKQNDSTSDHNKDHKEMSGNEINVGQSVISSSSNKLKQLFCETCQKYFRREGDLIIHMRSHMSEKPYECNVCKKRFNYKCSLDNHTRTHTGEKPYQCNICKKCFSMKGHLDSHTLTHTGEKPYQCNVCKKCFNQKNILHRHTRIHTGEKPYECNVCKKCFNRKGSLEKHALTHTGEKPYECNVCKKCFNQKGHLDKHTRTHTGEKPYKCNVCMKCFNRKEVLDCHMRIHTGEKPFKCNVCQKCFSDKRNIGKHICLNTN